jgi:hypothetical protein
MTDLDRLLALAEATANGVLHNVREDYRYGPELRNNAGGRGDAGARLAPIH